MTPGWCSRAARAAVFAAVCVLLAALGHVMMSGTAVPWRTLGAAALATGAVSWGLAARERGPLLVVSVSVVVQGLLHSSFAFAQARAEEAGTAGASLAEQWARDLLCGPSAKPEDLDPEATSALMHAMGHGTGGTGGTHATHAVDSLGHGTPGTGSMGHDMVGMNSTGMLAAHLAAALLCGLWLAHGERAAFRILRALAGRFLPPLRVVLRLPVPPECPRVHGRRGRSDRGPRSVLLVHSITSRGPPAGTAVL
ncbi:hypothetical protein [Streptomyces sp. Z26]|uniref:hypothetical protein n=1 Tax=Streptomyces sp. Z26 TaxID=2500177 RepID=UPI000EF1624B|nr:hypothetical protein [Streptomyces sp. Z26]RLL67623.1 hypothetical protein D7M15_13055 [Streptomyces sp. Z26]